MGNLWDAIQNPERKRFRYEGKFLSVYIALVTDNKDPEKRGRIKVKPVHLLGSKETWWLLPMTPAGGANDLGFFWIPEIGAQVWIVCQLGDPDHMFWFATTWGAPKGQNEVPKLAREVADETTKSPKGTDSATSAPIPSPRTLQEPSSPYAPVYPSNRVIKSRAGHVIELDDTKNAERVHIWHKSGTYIEIDKDGNMSMRVQGNLYQVVEGDYQLHVKGNQDVVVDGTRTTKVGDSLSVDVGGDKLQTIGGSVLETVNAAGSGVSLTQIPGIHQVCAATKKEEIALSKIVDILVNQTTTIGVAEVRIAATIRDQAGKIDHN